jgi:hypothetical protein
MTRRVWSLEDIEGTMAAIMLTPQDARTAEINLPGIRVAIPSRWRRAAVQTVRQNAIPWLAVKGTLAGLVFLGFMGLWPAFVLDTAVSAAVIAYGWWLARR